MDCLGQFSVFFVWAKLSFVIIYANKIQFSSENEAEDVLSNFLSSLEIKCLISSVIKELEKESRDLNFLQAISQLIIPHYA